ncbi:MAG: hypothetical protein KAI24_18140 [Planctomycetes bacterium]|nr:hypothetical protein [Planctomycetota bacterium]
MQLTMLRIAADRERRQANSMATRFGTQSWDLAVPDGWEASHGEDCATLVGPTEVGALQISAAFKDSEVLDDDLRDFASEHLDAGATPHACSAGDFTGFEICFSDGETFWRQWFLRHARQMLFVTYNCSVAERGVEDGLVEEILASLRSSVEGVA